MQSTPLTSVLSKTQFNFSNGLSFGDQPLDALPPRESIAVLNSIANDAWNEGFSKALYPSSATKRMSGNSTDDGVGLRSAFRAETIQTGSRESEKFGHTQVTYSTENLSGKLHHQLMTLRTLISPKERSDSLSYRAGIVSGRAGFLSDEIGPLEVKKGDRVDYYPLAGGVSRWNPPQENEMAPGHYILVATPDEIARFLNIEAGSLMDLSVQLFEKYEPQIDGHLRTEALYRSAPHNRSIPAFDLVRDRGITRADWCVIKKPFTGTHVWISNVPGFAPYIFLSLQVTKENQDRLLPNDFKEGWIEAGDALSQKTPALSRDANLGEDEMKELFYRTMGLLLYLNSSYQIPVVNNPCP